jgi:hypothetical protein
MPKLGSTSLAKYTRYRVLIETSMLNPIAKKRALLRTLAILRKPIEIANMVIIFYKKATLSRVLILEFLE